MARRNRLGVRAPARVGCRNAAVKPELTKAIALHAVVKTRGLALTQRTLRCDNRGVSALDCRRRKASIGDAAFSAVYVLVDASSVSAIEFDALDLEARYNHLEKNLVLSVPVFPELAEILESERPLEAAGRSKSFIAGAGFEPATSGL